jgi:RNA polymerase sigma-70 factor, ECF subfamily
MQVAVRERDAAGVATDSGALWLEFRHSLRAFVARRVTNPADVDDIVQWVFLQMHRSLGEIRSGARVHAWLYTTARRAIADYYRSRTRTREVPSGDALDLDVLGAGAGPASREGVDERAEVAACLAPVVERLGAADREAIRLIEIEGARLADAAALSGLSLPGMKSRIQRARRRLRQAMLACCQLALDGRGMPIGCEGHAPTGGRTCGSSAERGQGMLDPLGFPAPQPLPCASIPVPKESSR